MKKALLFLVMGALATGTASAQCSFDSQYAGASGNFFPDSTTFLANNYATINMAYDATISMKTISDTLVTAGGFTVTAYIDAFKIYQINGAPAGFNFTGGGDTYETADPRTDFNDPSDSTWWNNYGTPNNATTLSPVQGCFQITADAASVTAAAPVVGYTDYPVVVLVDARVAATNPDVSGFLLANGTWLSETSLADPLPVDNYVLRVYGPTGVSELLNGNVFDVAQSYPNPATDHAMISFTTPTPSNVEIRVYNMLGALVHKDNVLSKKGVNDYKLRTDQMASGLYIYTVSNNGKTITKKMNVR
ncbi:MAG: T9SS type A sorting domain-containing protein [Flavobacteriales bacterium]|nr:T9SS type A sorting domain-containing protein [Flavobacteriales bacterium]